MREDQAPRPAGGGPYRVGFDAPELAGAAAAADPRLGVLSDLTRSVVGAILGGDPREWGGTDPFARALERYQTGGEPPVLAARWRRLLSPVRQASSPALPLLLRLDRDLLQRVVEYATGEEISDVPAAPLRRVRPGMAERAVEPSEEASLATAVLDQIEEAEETPTP